MYSTITLKDLKNEFSLQQGRHVLTIAKKQKSAFHEIRCSIPCIKHGTTRVLKRRIKKTHVLC